jgi:hypothetical protein
MFRVASDEVIDGIGPTSLRSIQGAVRKRMQRVNRDLWFLDKTGWPTRFGIKEE